MLLEHPDDFQRACLLFQIASDLMPENPLPSYHMALLLLRGEYTDEEGGIKCPMHGWRFDLRTGQSNRPAHAQVYETKTERNTVFVAILAS